MRFSAGALLPTGADAAAGKVALSEGPWVALAQAQARQHEALAELLRGLLWWKTVDDPLQAARTLREADQGGDGPPPAA
jgi:hypothetical protein